MVSESNIIFKYKSQRKSAKVSEKKVSNVYETCIGKEGSQLKRT